MSGGCALDLGAEAARRLRWLVERAALLRAAGAPAYDERADGRRDVDEMATYAYGCGRPECFDVSGARLNLE